MAYLTKKAIAAYNKYGIETKDGKLVHPVLGLVNELLINGNDKIGKGCWHFSTLPTNKTYVVNINGKEYELLGTCPCHCDGCYATKGNYRFQSSINALGMRTWLVLNDLDFVKRCIMAQIEAYNIRLVRIHASGDFVNDEYIEMWREIAIANPDVVMWSYTKNVKAETAFDGIDNVNIVKSIVRGFGFNFGHIDYIIKVYNALKAMGKSVYICRCGIDKNQHCVNCHACSKCEYVLFIEHSTDYKAEKDPRYNEIVELIEAQEDIR